MSEVASAWVHLNGNMLCAVDVETTGRDAGWHEIIQIGIQPLDSQCKPVSDISPFYHTMKPEHPERAEPKATAVHKLDIDYIMVHSPDKWQVADYLDEWFTNLPLPHRKSMTPLAQNWSYERGFLSAWLGIESFDQFFYWAARDTMLDAIFINDKAYKRGKTVPFPQVGLAPLCSQFGIINENPHDALADARAEAELYRHLLEFEI